MKLIDTTEWGEFRIGDLFPTIERAKRRTLNDYSSGETPYVTNSSINNGVSTYLQSKSEADIETGGCITVNTVDGSAFWQESDFLANGSGNGLLMLRNEHLNEPRALFVCGAIKAALEAGFSVMLTVDSVRNAVIRLPADSAGDADWTFMESSMRAIMNERDHALETLFAIWDAPRHAVDTKDWAEFKVVNLFTTIVRGKCGRIGQLPDGDTPYIAASYANNGHMRDVHDPDGSFTSEGNCIAMISDGNGGIGRNTYQAAPFVGSTNLQLGYQPQLNVWNGLFLVACLDKSVERFNYNFAWKRTGHTFQEETVLLPTTSSGEPDWAYMEVTMRVVMEQREQALDLLMSLEESK
ncbi:restriction endonuclease subunit S [Microbacterium oryzae]|uniref:restriction endonuclease subunit S n=1 Tax=Microbacterium oryzae TaxID=743009 RepID=UPI0025B161E4|nr:restriction endonuclease subunit S [Microbacterium oryzae]MDN3311762.1 restriction endonuclease subunit S [Microbacterium oryzae]